MNYKKEIQSLLDELKAGGYTRAKIEQDLNYSDKYITQQLAKGGNERLLLALRRYRNNIPAHKVAKSNPGGDLQSQDDYMNKYIRQLERENSYLQELIQTNLTLVLATVRTLSVRQRAVGEVVLHSLERIEKKTSAQSLKATGTLVSASDMRIDQIEREAFARDNDPVMNR